MPKYSQANGPFAIKTPLGEDVLLLTGFRVRESISQLFQVDADLLAPDASDIAFDRVLGQSVTVEMRLLSGDKRYFNGIVKRFTQGSRDENFSHFRAEIVPKFWLLTKKIRSRIFQHLTVPDILREVLSGLDVVHNIHGIYSPREYCVQYRESDFHFVSRLMEEEGIYYFFTHADGAHRMVLTDLSNHHPAIPGQNHVPYDEAAIHQQADMSIWSWEKTQELRAGNYTVWDHLFQAPKSNLEGKEHTIGSILVGQVNHKLKVGGNDQLEIYEYPGGYAYRFDGIDRNGQPKPEGVQSVFRESQRTVTIRMEQEEAAAIEIRGVCNCLNFVPGHNFSLEHHFDGDGEYLLTNAEHQARLGDNYLKGDESDFHYETQFTCIPDALSYRPQRQTPKPVISGTQTAVVVGPAGEEIFCDKYGRVKVQFYWDREGKKNANSSCWLRVAQVWAGNGWGAFFWPRVGHEVVVSFEEGDPDRPLIIGSVYNAENMPPMHLPGSKMLCGIKSASVRGNVNKNFNGITFVDENGKEHLALHSERHLVLVAEFDVAFQNGRHHFKRTPGAHMVTVGSLPGTGGSGGGHARTAVDGFTTPTGGGSGGSATIGPKSGTPWAQPEPTSAVGLNSSVVYGSSFQSSWPIALQLANNSYMTITVDAAGFEQAFPGYGTPMIISSLGLARSVIGASGNVQLTLGNAANIVMGRSYDVQIGPEKVEVHANYLTGPAILSPTLAGLLGMIAIIFQEAYALLGSVSSSTVSDDARGLLVWAFQSAVQILLWSLLSSAVAYKIAETEVKIEMKKIHNTEDLGAIHELTNSIEDLTALQSGPLGLGNAIGALIVPTLVDSISEAELSQD